MSTTATTTIVATSSSTTATQNDMLNTDVCISGKNLLLVPYLKHHVLRYHDWLLREDILEATCSEPQSLEEEYENQVSWMESDDKMTFIILAPLSVSVSDVEERRRLLLEVRNSVKRGDERGQQQHEETKNVLTDVFELPIHLDCFGLSNDDSNGSRPLPSCLQLAENEMESDVNASRMDPSKDSSLYAYNPMVMIGDCNLFKMPIHHTSEGEVEVSVMLAENRFRGKGLAREAVGLLMAYAYEKLKRSSFVAKILASNQDSRNLFEKGSLGFSPFKEVKAFDEVHYLKRLRPFLCPETGEVVEKVINTDGEEVVIKSPRQQAETEGAQKGQSIKDTAKRIESIEDLQRFVGYKRHAYTPEGCEQGRTIALTNVSENAFY